MLLRTHTKSFPLFHTPDEGKSRQNRQVSERMKAATLQLFSGHNVSLVRQHKVPIEAYLFRNRVLSVENCNLFRHNINIYTLKASRATIWLQCVAAISLHSFPSLCRIFCVRKLKEWTDLMSFHLNAAGSVHIFSLLAQKRDHNATLSLYCIYSTLGDAEMHFLS